MAMAVILQLTFIALIDFSITKWNIPEKQVT